MNVSAFECVRVGIRTPNLLIRSQVLYPIELRILESGRKSTFFVEFTNKHCSYFS